MNQPRDPVARRLPVDSLAFALLAAARVCLGVREGRTLRDGLAAEAARITAQRKPGQSGRSDPHGAVHDLAARALRARGRADALLRALAKRTVEPPLLHELLVVSIALLVDAIDPSLPDDAPAEARLAGLPYPPFTLVDQAVHAAQSQPELARSKGFVNAVLRTLLRRIESDRPALARLVDGPSASTEAREGLPAWWSRRLHQDYPDDWPGIVRAGLDPPPLVLRVNRRRAEVEAMLARFAGEGIAATRVGPSAIRLERGRSVARIPGFAEGEVSVQDAAAQLAAPLLDVADGMRVLDACAAPGGKTCHVLELADAEMVALDADAGRLRRVEENLDRLGLSAQPVAGDASRPDGWWDGRRFDRILADVPCTASGIVRRHPDIRWLRREGDIRRLSLQAQQITDALWPLLNPGGKLLFVTCSVFPEESARHADSFARSHPDALVLPAPGQLLSGQSSTGVATQDHDGLFFALFEKMQ